ncbi:MAG: hypothetical protein K2Q01_12090 [Rickettsiales bacterium]|nr:hypothetical protein [Rickettsiales bacterium]
MPRILKAAMLAPLIFVGAIAVLLAIFYHEAIIAGGEKAQMIVMLAVVGLLLLMNILILAFGWPYYRFLKKRGLVTRGYFMLGGFVLMGLLGLGIAIWAHHAVAWKMAAQACFYGLLGAFNGWLIWRLGVKEKTPK